MALKSLVRKLRKLGRGEFFIALAVGLIVVTVLMLWVQTDAREHWQIPAIILVIACISFAHGLAHLLHASALRTAIARLAETEGPTDQNLTVGADWSADTRAVWRAIVHELTLPLLLGLSLLLTETSLLARADLWLGSLSRDQGLPTSLHLPAVAGLSALILATLKAFWTRGRQRLALTSAIATELLASETLARQSVDFPAVRKAFVEQAGGRPIAVASSRPYLFVSSDQDSLVDLPPELLDPLVRMLNLEHALSVAWEKLDSESFQAANQTRRGKYVDQVEGLSQQCVNATGPMLFRIAFYCALRRWLPL